jgi:hypothetical protein
VPAKAETSSAEEKKARQRLSRLALLEHLLAGEAPITEEELAAVRDEWSSASEPDRQG